MVMVMLVIMMVIMLMILSLHLLQQIGKHGIRLFNDFQKLFSAQPVNRCGNHRRLCIMLANQCHRCRKAGGIQCKKR